MRAFLAKRPLLFAHRGCSKNFPENTLPAFARAIALKIDALELDLRLTADHQLVIFHDPEVSRVTNGHGFIQDFTLKELKILDAGFFFQTPDGDYPFRGQKLTIPTLDELLETIPGIRLNIDLKNQAYIAAEQLLRIIQERQLFEQLLVGSFNHEILTYFRKISQGQVATSASNREVWRWGLSQKLGFTWPGQLAMDALQIPTRHRRFDLTTPRFIRAAHRHGLQVHYWTINIAPEMVRLLDAGADGLMTDDPELLVQVFQGWQQQNPNNFSTVKAGR
jgi:glycerophosphoryl diester phosphodiesterase